jgi:hypothetical protein
VEWRYFVLLTLSEEDEMTARSVGLVLILWAAGCGEPPGPVPAPPSATLRAKAELAAIDFGNGHIVRFFEGMDGSLHGLEGRKPGQPALVAPRAGALSATALFRKLAPNLEVPAALIAAEVRQKVEEKGAADDLVRGIAELGGREKPPTFETADEMAAFCDRHSQINGCSFCYTEAVTRTQVAIQSPDLRRDVAGYDAYGLFGSESVSCVDGTCLPQSGQFWVNKYRPAHWPVMGGWETNAQDLSLPPGREWHFWSNSAGSYQAGIALSSGEGGDLRGNQGLAMCFWGPV